MRKLMSCLFISLYGVVGAPDKYVRRDLYQDFPELQGKMHEEWSPFWPASKIEPFATFIDNVPKFVVSGALREVNWKPSTLISHDLAGAIANLTAQSGKTIGVHGVSLFQPLLLAGAMDELHFILVPVIPEADAACLNTACSNTGAHRCS